MGFSMLSFVIFLIFFLCCVSRVLSKIKYNLTSPTTVCFPVDVRETTVTAMWLLPFRYAHIPEGGYPMGTSSCRLYPSWSLKSPVNMVLVGHALFLQCIPLFCRILTICVFVVGSTVVSSIGFSCTKLKYILKSRTLYCL